MAKSKSSSAASSKPKAPPKAKAPAKATAPKSRIHTEAEISEVKLARAALKRHKLSGDSKLPPATMTHTDATAVMDAWRQRVDAAKSAK